MNIIELITALTPLAGELAKEIFGNRRGITRARARDKLKNIQEVLKNTKKYLEDIKSLGNYLSVYLDLGYSAEKMAGIVEKLRFLSQTTLKDITLFDSQSQSLLDDLQEIFDQEISTFDFNRLLERHRSWALDKKENISISLRNISNERDVLSDSSKDEAERKKAKSSILKSLTAVKQIADSYIGYKDKVLKETINKLMLGQQ